MPPALLEVLVKLRTCDEFQKTASALGATAHLASYVNNNSHNPSFWKDSANALDKITPVMHLILSMQRPTGIMLDERTDPATILREMIRLTLLIFLAKLNNIFSILKIDLTTTVDKFLSIEKHAVRIDVTFSHLTIWSIVTVVVLLEEEKRNFHLG